MPLTKDERETLDFIAGQLGRVPAGCEGYIQSGRLYHAAYGAACPVHDAEHEVERSPAPVPEPPTLADYVRHALRVLAGSEEGAESHTARVARATLILQAALAGEGE